MSSVETKAVDVLIIGAGFSGMCAAIKAREVGLSVLVVEKGNDFGGVWRENTYPGAACDVPWYLYSFSFYKDVQFSRPYPQQAEILNYQRQCAAHYGLYECTQFNLAVESARWDERQANWVVTADSGETFRAKSLISCVGVLSRPSWPAIPGLAEFEGECFHSAEWRHDVDLKGRRVGVIGTGASAIQFIPEIAKEAGELTVFQRSPPYCLPRFDTPYGPVKRWLFKNVPLMRDAYRYALWKFGETLALTFNGKNLTSRVVALVCGWIRWFKLRDSELRAKLTPDYAPGCKRILFTSNYFPTFQRPNVTLHVDGIDHITPRGVVDKDGREHRFDVLVMGTGFKATEFLAPIRIEGRGGRDLHDSWRPSPAAHLGMTVPGFPNLFMMYGPNTNLGSNSIIYMIECQAHYIVQALRAIDQKGSMEVKPDIYDRFKNEIQTRLKSMVWASGCESWYQSADGHNPTNWPGLTAEYRERTEHLQLSDFSFQVPNAASSNVPREGSQPNPPVMAT